MKNFFYFSIALVTLSLTVSISQSENTAHNNLKSNTSTAFNHAPNYVSFNSSAVDGDPAKPPRD